MEATKSAISHRRRIMQTGAFLIVLLLATLVLAPKSEAVNSGNSREQNSLPVSTSTARSWHANTNTSIPANQTSTTKVALAKVSIALQNKLDESPNAQVRYLVTLAEQADTSNNIKDWNAKGWYVYDKLKEVADRTQPAVIALLSEQKAIGNVQSYKRYVISNALSAVGNIASVNTLATLSEVASIDVFPKVEFTDAVMRGGLTATPIACPICGQYQPADPEWNVSLVHAPQAWAMGYTGAGVTIGSIDSGAFYQHETIVGNYRGNLGGNEFNHNYNWWDATNGTPTPSSTATPYDTDGHGTHTIGTLVGGPKIGIAPGAKWIAVRYQYSGQNVEPDIIEGMDFMLCPWDLNQSNRDCNKRPKVVSNSWTIQGNPDCSLGDSHPYLTWINNWRSAGIFPSFAAGNIPLSNTYPAAYPESFETGSVNRNNIKAPNSSIGPSCIIRGDRQLPQIVAGGGGSSCLPDQGVLSAGLSNGTYCYYNGTSMAQPATAGAVAIIIQANPNLTVDEIENILRDTAAWYSWYETTQNPSTNQPCGGGPDAPNPCYGYGLLRIDAAVQAALGGGATPTPTPLPCGGDLNNYTVAQSTGSIVQGTGDPINSCDDCSSIIHLPSGFSFRLYDQTFTSADDITVTDNGSLFFGNGNQYPPPSATACLPGVGADFTYAIFPHWMDLSTEGKFDDETLGIYTSTSGSAPNRIFNIEWRACYVDKKTRECVGYVDFEVRLHESNNGTVSRPSEANEYGSKPDTLYAPDSINSIYPSEFEVILGSNPNGSEAIIGVLKNQSAFTSYSCHQSVVPGLKLVFTLPRPCPTNTPTRTPTPTPTYTYTPTSTNTPTNTPTPTPTPCPPSPTPVPGSCQIQFKDVPPGPSGAPGSEFYVYVRCLACRSVATGYECGGEGEPCDCQNTPYFRPYVSITRGQLSKIVSNAAAFNEDPGAQIFEDVPPGPNPPRHPFYDWINRIGNRGIIGGYECEQVPGEPCVAPDNRPYFRSGNNATRGQVAKMVSNAAGYTEGHTYWRFQDTPVGSTFYIWVERLASRGIIGGYPCNSIPQEPCVSPDNRSYFRPYNEATRGQTSKIVANTFFPECQNISFNVNATPSVFSTGTPGTPPPTTTPQTSATAQPTPPGTPYIPSPVPSIPLPVPSVPMPIPTGPVPTIPIPSPSAIIGTTTVVPTSLAP